ncbi:MAG: DUF1552 domain-containing protein [Opitutales bacterium]|jgi:hypothetical protein|nr:DUF1552 domain-containing protein [Opitutales bacterium]
MKRLYSSTLSRRHFLRGVGLSLALPAFDSLTTGSLAASLNHRPRRMICVGNHLGFWPGGFFPKTSGLDYETSLTLGAIDHHRKDFTVFSNLDHELNGGHKAVHAFLSGVKKSEASGFAEKNMTVDQAAAEFAGNAARFPSITAGLGGGTDMCWTRSGVRIPPVSNPSRLFQALFVNSDKAVIERERDRLKHRSSVLDALQVSAQHLNGKLNASDRDKLDQYLTSVREVEKRLQMSKAWIDRPKPDAPIDPVLDEARMHIEELPLMYDLLVLALQTDSTRVATMEIPMAFKSNELEVGSYHGLSHHGKEEGRLAELQVVEAYLMKQFGYLMDRLKEAQLFDDTLVILGSGMGNAHTHSNRDVPLLLAGGGIQHQGHLKCPEEKGKRIPLSNLWLSSLHWFGLEIERFGRSTGTFSPMPLV